MTTSASKPHDLEAALAEVSASSAGGAPFLLAFGATFLLTALLAFGLPQPTVALIAMFQGSLALPAALWLERRLGWRRMAPDNPLRALSAQLAMSQNLALPAWIVAYSLNPGVVPMVMAATGAAHFLPYAWLHRTRLYAVLAGALSLGSFALQLALKAEAFPYILLFVAGAYWIAAPLVYRHAARLAPRPAEAAPLAAGEIGA
ncbi:MAG: hypothetical protein JNK29_15810 [Anaerolineales bacterium]|nr:hypothetical protein [Anaerolineales bacterium]